MSNAAVDSFSIGGYTTTTPYVQLNTVFTHQNIGVNSSQNLYNFDCSEIQEPTALLNPIAVHITEYGNIGQFISGNFSGTLTGTAPPNNSYVITANFRVRRYY